MSAVLSKPVTFAIGTTHADHVALRETSNLFVMHTVRSRTKSDKPDQNSYTKNQRAMREAACKVIAVLEDQPFVAVENVVPATYETNGDQSGLKSMTFRRQAAAGTFKDYRFTF